MSKNYSNEHPKYNKENPDKNIKVAGPGNSVVLKYAEIAAKITGLTVAYFKMNPEEAYKIYLGSIKK